MAGRALRLSANKGLRLRAGALLPWALLALAAAVQLAGTGPAIALGLAFFIAGLPHGAADDDGRRIARWKPLGIAVYLLVAASLALFALAQPLAALVVFLLLSAWHFATHEPGLYGWAIGLTAIGGSALWQGEATAAVFAAVTGAPVPGAMMMALAAVGGTGLVLAALSARRDPAGSVLLLAAPALLHPVLAVGLIFLAAHAAPVLASQMQRYGVGNVARAVWPTALAAALGSAALIAAVLLGWTALPLAAAFAIALATPHMLLDRLDEPQPAALPA